MSAEHHAKTPQTNFESIWIINGNEYKSPANSFQEAFFTAFAQRGGDEHCNSKGTREVRYNGQALISFVLSDYDALYEAARAQIKERLLDPNDPIHYFRRDLKNDVTPRDNRAGYAAYTYNENGNIRTDEDGKPWSTMGDTKFIMAQQFLLKHGVEVQKALKNAGLDNIDLHSLKSIPDFVETPRATPKRIDPRPRPAQTDMEAKDQDSWLSLEWQWPFKYAELKASAMSSVNDLIIKVSNGLSGYFTSTASKTPEPHPKSDAVARQLTVDNLVKNIKSFENDNLTAKADKMHTALEKLFEIKTQPIKHLFARIGGLDGQIQTAINKKLTKLSGDVITELSTAIDEVIRQAERCTKNKHHAVEQELVVGIEVITDLLRRDAQQLSPNIG